MYLPESKISLNISHAAAFSQSYDAVLRKVAIRRLRMEESVGSNNGLRMGIRLG